MCWTNLAYGEHVGISCYTVLWEAEMFHVKARDSGLFARGDT